MRIAAFLLGAALAVAPAPAGAQSPVIISEVGFAASGDGDWIELFNRSSGPADLTGFSIYQATKTAGQPQTYWWRIPNGTSIPSNSFLRVRWRAAIPMTPVPGEIATGNSIFNFLFGLGSEPFSQARGALGLFSTTDNALMNDPSVIRDWVSWGETGFAREDLAVQNDRWQAGAAVRGIVDPSDSLALAIARAAPDPTPVTAWFRDASPTPGDFNATGAGNVSRYGTATRLNSQLLQEPALFGSNSPTAPGNRDLVISVDGTTGNPNEVVFVAVSEGQLTTPLPVLRMDVFIDPAQVVADFSFVPSQLGTTPIFNYADLTPSLSGVDFYAQAFIVNIAVGGAVLGSSNAIAFSVGSQ